MKLKHTLIIAMAVVLLAPLAYATGAVLSGSALHLYPNSAADCKPGDTCLWSNGNTTGPVWRKADGTDTTLGGGGGGSGTVTSVTASSPLTGGTFSTSGSIGLGATGPGAATTGGGASYINSVTTDVYGRIASLATGTPIGGSIASTQVAVGSGTNAIGGSSGLTYSSSVLGVTGSLALSSSSATCAAGKVRYNGTHAQTCDDGSNWQTLATLGNTQNYTASQNVEFQTLTFGSTINTDASVSNYAVVTLTGNATVANPTNLPSTGGVFQWQLDQDSTGSRTVLWGSKFKWPGAIAPVLQTAANAKDLISCAYDGTDLLCGSLAGGAGGASVGNYSFSSNAMDLSGAATMSIAPATATAIALGQTTTLAANKSLVLASGTGGADFSAASGAQKSTTGAQTFGGSSYALDAAFTGSMGFSLVDYCSVNGGTLATAAGGETVGVSMVFTKPVTLTTFRFYWAGGAGATTVTVSVWDHAGTQVATLSGVAVNAAGVYSGTFGTPVVVDATKVYQLYTVGMYNAAHYTYQPSTASLPGGYTGLGLIVSPWVEWINNTLYVAANAQPTTSAGSGTYMPVELGFTSP